jgi:predicted nucleic acid-binding protein
MVFPNGRTHFRVVNALLLISEIRQRLSVIALDSNEYVDALQKAATQGISGGSVYDALFAASALKAKAETIYTWNTRHYSLCGPDVTARLRRP